MNDTSKIYDADNNDKGALFGDEKLNPFDDNHSDVRSSFGLLLREYREGSGYSVERAAVATRISYPFIEALEDSDLSKLPAKVFGRGFIRNLCKVYGRDPDTVLNLYESSLEMADSGVAAFTDRPVVASAGTDRLLKTNKSIIEQIKPFFRKIALHRSSKVKIVFGLLTVSVVVGVGYWLYQSNLAISTSNVSATKVAETPSAEPVKEAALDPAVTTNEQDSVVEAADMKKKLDTQVNSGSGVKEGTLVAEVNVATKIEIDRYDGKGAQVVSFDPGSHTIKFDRKVTLVLQDVNALELSYLGKPIGDLSARGKSRRITLGSVD